MSKELAERSNHALATQPEPQSGNLLAIIQKVTETPTLTGEHVAVIERLVALQERQEARTRKDAFDAAHRECVKEMPRVDKNGHVKTSAGAKIYSYARLEDLDASIRPIYERHGFGVSYDAPMATDGKIRVTAVFTCAGHSERREISASPSNRSAGGVNLTDAQKTKQTITECRRHLLEMFFNIITEDADAPPKENPITQDQADDIAAALEETRSNKAAFLAAFRVNAIGELRASQLSSVWAAINKKRGVK